MSLINAQPVPNLDAIPLRDLVPGRRFAVPQGNGTVELYEYIGNENELSGIGDIFKSIGTGISNVVKSSAFQDALTGAAQIAGTISQARAADRAAQLVAQAQAAQTIQAAQQAQQAQQSAASGSGFTLDLSNPAILFAGAALLILLVKK